VGGGILNFVFLGASAQCALGNHHFRLTSSCIYRSERVLYPLRILAAIFSTSKDSKDEKILGIREIIPNVLYISGEYMK
jgi:hypothetical protein